MSSTQNFVNIASISNDLCISHVKKEIEKYCNVVLQEEELQSNQKQFTREEQHSQKIVNAAT